MKKLKTFILALILFPTLLLFISLLGSVVNPLDYSVNKQTVLLNDNIANIKGNYFEYKLKLIETKKPEVISVGSSRALQFREFMFSRPFISAGYAVHSVSELERFINLLLDKKEYDSVKSLVVVIDPEWLNSNYQVYPVIDKKRTSYFRELKASVKKFFKPFILTVKYLTDLSNPVYLAYFDRKFNHIFGKKISGGCCSGFRDDGSYYYYGILYGARVNQDFNFEQTLGRLNREESRFKSGGININALASIKNLKQKIIESGKGVVFVLPPYAPSVWKELLKVKSRHSYLFNLKTNKSLIDFDFSDPAVFNSEDDCEYVDGIHGSDVVYSRMLIKISEDSKGDNLYINKEEIVKNLNEYRGKNLISSIPSTSYIHTKCK